MRLRTRRRARWLLALLVVAPAWAVVAAGPAAADITPAGKCTGSGTFEKGTKARGPFTEESSSLPPGRVIEVPVADTVRWHGTVRGVQKGVRRKIDGFVKVDLPWPVGGVTVDSWGKSTIVIENFGEHKYRLPKTIPRGVEFRVYGQHKENGSLFCKGFVLVKVEGSAFDTPVTWASLVATFGAGALLLLAGRPVFKKLWAYEDGNPE